MSFKQPEQSVRVAKVAVVEGADAVHTIRYDSRCYFNVRSSRKPIRVSLIYSTEITTKNCNKTEKVKTDMLRSNSKSLENHVVSPEEETRKAAVGRICTKGRLKSPSLTCGSAMFAGLSNNDHAACDISSNRPHPLSACDVA